MGLDRGGWLATALFAFGAAALVLALVPAAWPNPLPQGDVAPADALPKLREAATAVDAACSRGDLAAFANATTAQHRADLQQRLAALQLPLDSATLRELAVDAALTPWLDQPLLAGEVRGDRVVVAFARPGGDGAQCLAFVWSGRGWRFDGARHAVGVGTAAGAATWLCASWPERNPRRP